jgi:hypothetical protein
VPRKAVQYTSRDEVYPIAYTRDGIAKISLNLYYRNVDFLKFLYALARYLPGINFISRLIFSPVWVGWEVWQRKAKRSAPANPEEDIVVDPRIGRLIKAIASVVSNDKIPEEVALRIMALNLALIRASEDGVFHEIGGKVSKVYAMADIYLKYLKGEIGDEELTANLGSVQLSTAIRTPSTPITESSERGSVDNNEERVTKHIDEDGVFAKLFASLMFSTTTSKHENY